MKSTSRVRRWWPAMAGGAALSAAAVFGVGTPRSLLSAEEGKPVEKKPADVHVGAPPELEALRRAVEKAGKKGENVDEIRQHLESLEKALTGRAWVKPQPPVEIVRPGQPPRAALQAFPAMPEPGLDAEAMRKTQEMLRRAQENLRANPQDHDAVRRLMEEQQRIMREAMAGLGGRIAGVPGIAIGPGNILNLGGPAARSGEGRLGVRLDRVPLVVADQLEMPAGRGLVVVDVVPGSAAEKAGLKASDIILEFAGQAVTDDTIEFIKRVQEAKIGEKTDVTVLRKGKKETLKVELPEMNRRQAQAAPFGARAGNSVRISNNNGQIDVQADTDGVFYAVKGELVDGQLNVTEIKVTEGDKSTTYDSIDKVPAEHREKVQGLIGKFPRKNID